MECQRCVTPSCRRTGSRTSGIEASPLEACIRAPRGWGFEVMGPAGGNGLGQCLRYVDFCVANSTGSTMDGSSFSGLLTRVGLNSDVPAIDLA